MRLGAVNDWQVMGEANVIYGAEQHEHQNQFHHARGKNASAPVSLKPHLLFEMSPTQFFGIGLGFLKDRSDLLVKGLVLIGFLKL